MGLIRAYTLKYRINGALFRRKYAPTDAGRCARDSRADVLATQGIAVVCSVLRRRAPKKHSR